MNIQLQNNIIEPEIYKKIYTINMLIIIKKICEILAFYQEKCFFVHSDFNFKNIIICCEFDENSLVKNINVKIIDFSYSSIILYIDGKVKLFKDIGFSAFRILEYVNPYISNIWNKIDLLDLVSGLIYEFNNIDIFFKIEINNNIKYFVSILLELLHIPNVESIYENCITKIKNSNKEKLNRLSESYMYQSFISFFKSSNLLSVLKLNNIKEKDFYLNFIPSNLKELLKIKINLILSEINIENYNY
jgi:hypothetical protein